jgi:hypothetical protein
VNSKRSSESKKPDQEKDFRDTYSLFAKGLETQQLVFLLGYSLLTTEKYPKWEGREERREILRNELTRRAIDPYAFTLEDFRMGFKQKTQESQLGACIALVQREVAKANARYVR